MKAKIIYIALLISMTACMTEDPIRNDFAGFEPVQINDGWEIISPEDAAINRDTLTAVFEDVHNDPDLWMIRSFSVFRHGKIVAESYTRDESDRVTPRGFWSCTKQITGILAGIAIENGVLGSIEDSIAAYLPEIIEKHPDKGKITIRNLLMMQSGLAFDNYGLDGDDFQVLQEIPDSFVEYSLAKPYASQPGEVFDYKDSDPMIISAAIQNTVGEPTDVWANEVLFSKIGFTNYDWLRYKSGVTIGSYGILSTPREMAKIAQFVLNGGEWNDEQIVSREWISEMISPLNDAGDKKFGYLWWSYPEHGTYFMSGNGRQLIFVFPDKELIVAITTEAKLQGKFQLSTPAGRTLAKRIYETSD
ncbi:MAG: serine hydrolase domain-containing protein [Bacteroidota bacterium]